MTVLRNITLGPVKAQKMPRAEADQLARDLLARFGLADRAGEYPDRLSGGQQQRVAMIRALASGGMTMVLATHEMGFARDVASRVAFLADGEIVEIAPPADLLGRPQQERTQRFLRRVTDAGRL
jgi:polar amino acid transport system ATP-binding protein